VPFRGGKGAAGNGDEDLDDRQRPGTCSSKNIEWRGNVRAIALEPRSKRKAAAPTVRPQTTTRRIPRHDPHGRATVTLSWRPPLLVEGVEIDAEWVKRGQVSGTRGPEAAGAVGEGRQSSLPSGVEGAARDVAFGGTVVPGGG